jgi:hypothetical protein
MDASMDAEATDAQPTDPCVACAFSKCVSEIDTCNAHVCPGTTTDAGTDATEADAEADAAEADAGDDA